MRENMFINDYLANMRPYKTVSQEIWSIDSDEWNDVLKLDWNEATVGPAPQVKDEILKLVTNQDFFHIYPSTYNRELICLLAQYANVSERNVQYFSSSDSLHEYIARLYIGRGDKVLILWPSYDNFRSTVETQGAQVKYFDLGPDFSFNIDDFKKRVRDEAPKLVYVCNPNNPTGLVISKENIETMVAENPQTMFLIDEAYAEFANQSVNDLVVKYENLLVTHTMSKAFGLANIRFGYLVASADNVEVISRIRNSKNIPTVTQVAVIAALKNVDYMWKYVEEVNAAREWFYNKLCEAKLCEISKVYPSRGNFILLKCRGGNSKGELYYYLRERRIYVRQLTQSASVLNCIRITVGTREQMRRVFEALCEFEKRKK